VVVGGNTQEKRDHKHKVPKCEESLSSTSTSTPPTLAQGATLTFAAKAVAIIGL